MSESNPVNPSEPGLAVSTYFVRSRNVLLAQADWIPSLGDQLWDTSALLADDSLPGRALHALAGYSDRPMGVQVLAYVAVLLALAGLGRLVGARTRPHGGAADAPAIASGRPPGA